MSGIQRVTEQILHKRSNFLIMKCIDFQVNFFPPTQISESKSKTPPPTKSRKRKSNVSSDNEGEP